jgi:hypothetical protein
LPPVSFAYFDPISKIYKTLHRDSIQLYVQPSVEARSQIPQDGNPANSGLSREAVIFSIIALIIIGWIVFQVLRSSSRKTNKSKQQEVIVRTDTFAKARELYATGNDHTFFNEVLQQLCGIAGQKCQIEPSILNKKTIRERFTNAGLPASEVDEFI